MAVGFVRRAHILIAVVGAMALLGAGSAAAEKKRIGIPAFAGPQEALIRKAVMQAVKANGYDMIKSRQIESTASSIGASLDSNEGYKALAKELALSAFVIGEVGRKKATLTVRNGADGAVNAEETWTAANPRKLAADVARTFWRRLGSAVERGKPPSGAKKASKVAVAADAPEDNEEAPDSGAGAAAADDTAPATTSAGSGDKGSRAAKSDTDTAADGADKPKAEAEAGAAEASEKREEPAASGGPVDNTAPRALDAWVGGRLFFRSFTFHEVAADTKNNVANYLPRALGDAAALVDWYPAAHASSGFASNLGLEVNLEQSFGITSSTATGGSYSTNIHDYSGALRLRLPLGAVEGGVIVGYGQNAFTLSGSGRDNAKVPDITYGYVRAGLALKVIAGALSVSLGGGWRQVLSPGKMIKDEFPHLTVAGVDANLTVGYRVSSAIEVRVGGDLRRYFYDMHSVAGDTNKAGGAVDQTIALMGGVAFIIDGVARRDAASSKEAAPPPSDDGEVKVKKRKKKKKVKEESEDSASEE